LLMFDGSHVFLKNRSNLDKKRHFS